MLTGWLIDGRNHDSGTRCCSFSRLRRRAVGVRPVNQPPSKCYYAYVGRYGADIPLSVGFDGPPCLPHGLHGIFIAQFTHIGKNVTILQQVTIGEDTFEPSIANNRRNIGDNVFIGAGAKIIGGVVIGEGCRIGANCCVYSDMPPNTVAVNQPTRFIQKSNLCNFFRSGDCVFKDGGWVRINVCDLQDL